MVRACPSGLTVMSDEDKSAEIARWLYSVERAHTQEDGVGRECVSVRACVRVCVRACVCVCVCVRDGVVSFRLLSFRLLKIHYCHFAYSPHM